MITFSEPGDTSGSITQRVLGYNDDSYRKQLLDANATGFARKIFGGQDHFAPNRAVWLPSDNDINSMERDQILFIFDCLTSNEREILAYLEKNNVDIHQVRHAHHLAAQANQASEDKVNNLTGGLIAYYKALADNVIDLKTERNSNFKQAIYHAKDKLIDMAKASSKETALSAKEAFKKAMTNVQAEFGHELNTFKLTENYLLREPWNAARAIRKHGWKIFDQHVAKDVEHVARGLKWLGRGVVAIKLIEGTVETIDAWSDNRDWIETASKAAWDTMVDYLVAGIVAGTFIAIELTPAGWVGIIIVGSIAAFTGNKINEKYTNPLIDIVAKHDSLHQNMV